MQWNDVKNIKPEPMREVLVWVDGHRSAQWRNNHALVAYMTHGGLWFEERHHREGPLVGVIKWADIETPD